MKKTILALSIFVLLSISCKTTVGVEAVGGTIATAEEIPISPTTFADRAGTYTDDTGDYVLLLNAGNGKANLNIKGETARSVTYDPTAFAPAGASLIFTDVTSANKPDITITFSGLNTAISTSENGTNNKTLTKQQNNTTFEDREGTYKDENNLYELVLAEGTATFTVNGIGSEEVDYNPNTLAPAYQQVLKFTSYNMVFVIYGNVEYTKIAGEIPITLTK